MVTAPLQSSIPRGALLQRANAMCRQCQLLLVPWELQGYTSKELGIAGAAGKLGPRAIWGHGIQPILVKTYFKG